MQPTKHLLFLNITVWLKQGITGVLLLLATMVLLPAAVAETGNKQAGGRAPQYTKQGTEACTRCHSGEIIQVILKGSHGDKKNKDVPFSQRGCESCHGPGSFHISRAHGGLGFPGMVSFGAGKRTPAGKQVEACLSCHAKATGKTKGMKWQGSIHAGTNMTCSVCHKLHSDENAMANKAQQAESCFMCHPKSKTGHRRFENKGIVFDELSCWDCHDVHQLQRQKKAAAK